MTRPSTGLVLLLVVIIAAFQVGQAADAPVPLASISDNGQGDFSIATPSFSFTFLNTFANASIWTKVTAGATEGFDNSTIVGVTYTLTYQNDPAAEPTLVSTIGTTLVSDLALPYVINIPPCSTYQSVAIGDGLGNWTVSLSFTNISAVPEDYVVHAIVEIGAQATLLPLPQTTYSQQVQGSYAFATIEFGAFNSSYSSLNAEFTLTDLPDSTLDWLHSVELTQTQCEWNNSLVFQPNVTNATTTTIQLNNVQAGVWQMRIQSNLPTANPTPTVGVSWEITGYNPVKQDDKSWWTTQHIIYVTLAAVGGVLLVLIVVGVVVWLVKRKGAYEEV